MLRVVTALLCLFGIGLGTVSANPAAHFQFNSRSVHVTVGHTLGYNGYHAYSFQPAFAAQACAYTVYQPATVVVQPAVADPAAVPGSACPTDPVVPAVVPATCSADPVAVATPTYVAASFYPQTARLLTVAHYNQVAVATHDVVAVRNSRRVGFRTTATVVEPTGPVAVTRTVERRGLLGLRRLDVTTVIGANGVTRTVERRRLRR